MLSILYILITLVVIFISSVGYGTLLEKKNLLFQFGVGHLVLLGICQLVNSLLVFVEIDAIYIHLFNYLLIFIGIIIFTIKRKDIGRIKKFSLLLLAIYLTLFAYKFYNSAIGIETFDTLHYMSIVNNNAVCDKFGKIDYYSGAISNEFNVIYDFQMFYVLWGSILRFFSNLSKIIFDKPIVIIHIYIYASSIIFYLMFYGLFEKIVDYFDVKNKFNIIFIFLFILIFFSSQYYIKSLAFFGNSYRLLVVSYLMFLSYDYLSNSKIEYKDFIALGLVTSSLIAVSSSGFFISAIYLSCLTLLLIYKRENNYIACFSIIAISIIEFSAYYLNCLWILGAEIVFAVLSIIYDKYFSDNVKKKFDIFVKIFVVVLFCLVVVYSLSKGNGFALYFDRYSNKDMIFDYFYFGDAKHILINALIISSEVFYIFKNIKNDYAKFLIIILIIFNPLTVNFIINFLASSVFYRLFDLIFNYFNLMLFLIVLFANIKFKNGFVIAMIAIYGAISINEYVEYYHEYFSCHEDNYNKIYKAKADDIDISNALISDLYYSEINDAKIISQFPEILAYIPSIQNFLNYNDYRDVDPYSNDNDYNDELFRVFYPKEYADKSIFLQDTDYKKACELIIDNEVDYVIIDNNQTYLNEDGVYFPLNYHVRDCGDKIYENQSYTLYKFYWR